LAIFDTEVDGQLMYLAPLPKTMDHSTSPNLKVTVTNRQILSIALPISLATLVPQFNYITNNIFLGHLDQRSLAAAGITGVFYLIFAVIGNGMNNGLQALISRRAGEGRIREIGTLFSQGVRLALVLAVLGIVLTYLIGPWILGFSLKSDELRNSAVNFLKIRIWGLPFLYVYQLRNALLVGTNQSKFLIYGTATETLVNIALDYGLIFGHMGLPKMGFAGAAVASVIAEAAAMLVVFAVLHFQGIGKSLHLFSKQGFDWKVCRLILVQSAPLMFQYAISIISWEFFFILIEHHGQLELAISNSMRNIFGVFGCISWAFASATNTMVSNIIGQGMKDKVLGLIGKIVLISLSFSLFIAVLLNLFPGAFLAMYGQNQAFVQGAIPVVRVISVAIVLMSFSTIWLNAIVGTGNTKVNLTIEILTIVLYVVYVYLILGYFNLPILYGWMSEWVYWISIFLMAYFYMKSGKWKAKKI
jgi:multidrug resistance protein, MATE family